MRSYICSLLSKKNLFPFIALIVGDMSAVFGNPSYSEAHDPKYGTPVDVPLVIATEENIKPYGRYSWISVINLIEITYGRYSWIGGTRRVHRQNICSFRFPSWLAKQNRYSSSWEVSEQIHYCFIKDKFSGLAGWQLSQGQLAGNSEQVFQF